MTIQTVTLPAATGCNHLHLTIELDDLSVETRILHITDFNHPASLLENKKDAVFAVLAYFISNTYDLTTVTREQIKTLIEGETL